MWYLKRNTQLILKGASVVYYGLITCLFLILRLHNISRDIHFDEIASLAVSQKSTLSILLGRYGDLGDMPLYYLILKALTLFQNSEATLRIVSVLAGLFTLYIFFRICLAVFEKKSSTAIAVLLFSSSSIYMFYQQSARSYAFSVSIQLLIVLLLIINRKLKYLWSITALVGTLFAALFSSFSSLYFFLIVPVVWLLDKRYKKTSVISLMTLILITFFWHLQYRASPEYSEALQNYASKDNSFFDSLINFTLDQFVYYPIWTGSIDLSEFEKLHSSSLYQITPFVFILALLIILVEVILRQIKETRRNVYIIAVTFLFFISIPVLTSFVSFNIFQLRLHLLVVPLMIVLLVSVLETSRNIATRIAVFLILFFFLYTNIFSIFLSLKVKTHPIQEILRSVQLVVEKRNTLCIASHGISVHFFPYYLQSQHRCKTIPLTFNNESLYAAEKKQLHEHLVSGSFERVVFLEYYSNGDPDIRSMLQDNQYFKESVFFPDQTVSTIVYIKNQ